MERHVLCLIAAATAASLAAIVATSAASAPTAQAARRVGCSGLTSLRTLGVRPRRNIDWRARRTTIQELGTRERPSRIVHGASAFERQSFEVVAQITIVRRTLNNTVNLVLYDDNGYVAATLPPLECLTRRTPGRSLIAAARSLFVDGCGLPTQDWEPLGAVAYVSGVGYWGPVRGRRGAAHNGAALAPVTGIRFLAGCGAR